MSSRINICLILGLVVIVGLLILLLRLYGPVLLALYEAGDPSMQPYFVILNPLRDKAPENISENFLKQLSLGDCSEALTVFALSVEKHSAFCDKENENRFSKWTLINRSDDNTTSKLIYQVNSIDDPSYYRKIILSASRSGDVWKIDGADTYF